LLAARAVDEEHNHGRNGASLRSTREIPLTSSVTLPVYRNDRDDSTTMTTRRQQLHEW
jgi:hypothetical protein